MIKKAMFALALVVVFGFDAKAQEVDTYEIADPWESFNRPMFTFNYNMDKYVLKPVAYGYRGVTTQWMRNRVGAASANLTEPRAALNYALQGELKSSGISTGRFLVNTTLGLVGFFDVATGWGWELEKNKFDNTLGQYCVPDGPFLVLPFVPTTTPRAFVSSFVDGAANPIWWATHGRDDGMFAYGAYYSADMIALREANIEFTDDMERNSVDYYTAARAMYLQNKAKYNRCVAEASGGATYDFEFEE